jgi:hypothetical protein
VNIENNMTSAEEHGVFQNFIISARLSFGGYPPYSNHSVGPHFLSYNNSRSYDLSKKIYRYNVHCNSSINHISFYLCYLETVYTTLIVPVGTCKNEKVINK